MIFDLLRWKILWFCREIAIKIKYQQLSLPASRILPPPSSPPLVTHLWKGHSSDDRGLNHPNRVRQIIMILISSEPYLNAEDDHRRLAIFRAAIFGRWIMAIEFLAMHSQKILPFEFTWIFLLSWVYLSYCKYLSAHSCAHLLVFFIFVSISGLRS